MNQKIPGTSVVFDESEISQPAGAQPSRWVPPRHVFFGGRDEFGDMKPEPTYVYQEFPRSMYKLENTDDGLKMKVVVVHDEDQKQQRLDDGFKLTIHEWGIKTCPSFDELVEMRNIERGARRQAEAEVAVSAAGVVDLALVASAKKPRAVRKTAAKKGRRKAA